MKRLILIFLTLCFVHFFSFLSAQNDNLGIRKIVIDPGHGGKDPGTLGSGRYKTTEKDVVLNVSLLLGDYLKSAFLSVVSSTFLRPSKLLNLEIKVNSARALEAQIELWESFGSSN